MTTDDPASLAGVAAAFHAYERALMTDDLVALDTLFHDAPTTSRYGVGEAQHGIEAIRDFCKGRGGSPQRRLGRLAITAYRGTFATADVEFYREGSDRRGRQSRSRVRPANGWKIVSAHVSWKGRGALIAPFRPGWRTRVVG